MDPLVDFRETIKSCGLLRRSAAISAILSELDELDFKRKRNGDQYETYKYTITYSIGEYKFKYVHTNGEQLTSAAFIIIHNKESSEIFTWSLFQCSMARMNWSSAAGPLDVPSNVATNATYRNFCASHGFEDRLGEPLKLLTILNSFIFGLCVSPELTSPYDLAVFHLEDLLDVPDLETLEYMEHHLGETLNHNP